MAVAPVPSALAQVAARHRSSSDTVVVYALARASVRHRVPTTSLSRFVLARRPAIRRSPRLLNVLDHPERLTNPISSSSVSLSLSRWAGRIRNLDSVDDETGRPREKMPTANQLLVFTVVTQMVIESIERDGMNTAIVPTREVAARTGVDRRTANSAIVALLDRKWLVEVGHEEKKSRRLRVGGGPRVSDAGRVIADDPAHPFWHATDAQIAHHSDRTPAVKAWATDVLESVGVERRWRGDTSAPEYDPIADERKEERRRERDDQLEQSRVDRDRELRRNEVIRTILGDVPKATENKQIRRAWLRSAQRRVGEAIGDKGDTAERRHMRRAIVHRLKIGGYELDNAAAIAAHLIPIEGDD